MKTYMTALSYHHWQFGLTILFDRLTSARIWTTAIQRPVSTPQDDILYPSTCSQCPCYVSGGRGGPPPRRRWSPPRGGRYGRSRSRSRYATLIYYTNVSLTGLVILRSPIRRGLKRSRSPRRSRSRSRSRSVKRRRFSRSPSRSRSRSR